MERERNTGNFISYLMCKKWCCKNATCPLDYAIFQYNWLDLKGVNTYGINITTRGMLAAKDSTPREIKIFYP